MIQTFGSRFPFVIVLIDLRSLVEKYDVDGGLSWSPLPMMHRFAGLVRPFLVKDGQL